MSNTVFPSFDGLDVAVERESRYSTTVHTSVSGKEQRTSWQSTPRKTYRLKFNVLRESVNLTGDWGTKNEPATLLWFHENHKGSFDSFLFTDPYDSTQVRVRFVEDSLSFQKIVSGHWEAQATFITCNA